MKKRDFYLPSSDGKSRLHCVEWLPDGAELQTVKLWVQLVHGMNEHMGRYGEFASFLLLMEQRNFQKKTEAFLQRKTAELFCCAICAGWPVMVQNAIRMQNTSCLATAWVRF